MATTAQLRKALAEGAKIVNPSQPWNRAEVAYAPRTLRDPQPWLYNGYRFVSGELEADWGPDGKPVKLTETQAYIVKLFVERGDWYPGSGWVWSNRSTTIRMLDGLVRKGVLIRVSDTPYKERYTLSDLGHRQFNKPVGPTEAEVRIVLVMLAEQSGEWAPGCGWWYRNEKLTRRCLSVLVSRGLVVRNGDNYGLLGTAYDAAREAGYNPDLLMDEEG